MSKQTIEAGVLIESFSVGNPTDDLIKNAELFSAGTHRGRNYTSRDLLALASSFVAEEQIPLQLDHSESVKDTVGYLESVSVVGEKLMGKIRIIEKTVKEKVAEGLAKKLSISFYTDEKGNPQKIREVSLVAFPQVKTAQLFAEEYELVKLQEFADDLKKRMAKLVDNTPSRVDFKQVPRVDEDDKFYNNYLVEMGLKKEDPVMDANEVAYQQYLSTLGLGQKY
ncbi:hypothetical protein [Bacillus sp. UNC322MFChir4.1]|uniref:hypothetical protein n=1 Tax=Bacillus sp. UNC322MFChir4.1 TaxID=1449045 RepID=UPI000B2A50E2|nr:hypothetical protein [Bacillus sp. UNC322MFChir4.1]